MDSNKLENQVVIHKYEKPETKKHEAMNIVQGSLLYYTSLYNTTLYYASSNKLYYTSLYRLYYYY
jgi:hypothetical protein